MKQSHRLEFWYALLLGLGNCFLTAPTGFCSYKLSTYRGHDAALGWPFAIIMLVLLCWSWCRCGWELLLWRENRLGTAIFGTTTLVIFCAGLVALLLVLGLLFSCL